MYIHVLMNEWSIFGDWHPWLLLKRRTQKLGDAWEGRLPYPHTPSCTLATRMETWLPWRRTPLSIPCEGGVSAGLQKKKEGRGKLEADPGSRCYQLFSFHYFWYFLDSLIENISETRLRIYHQSCTPLEACGGWIMTLQKYPSLTSLNLWIVTLHGKSYFADDVIKSRPLRWRDDPGLSAWTTNIISSILTEGDREIWP